MSEPSHNCLAATAARTPGQRVLFAALMVSLVLITFSMTPLTERVDEIKFFFFFALGPALLALYFYLAARGSVARAPRSVDWLLAATLGVMLLSTAVSHHRWAGVYATGFMLAAIGFFYAAIGSIRTRADLERFLAATAWICLGTIAFASAQRSGVFEHIRDVYYNRTQPQPVFFGSPEQVRFPFWQLLIYTLALRRDATSVVFNRDFYAAYLDTVLPAVLGLAAASVYLWRQRFASIVYVLGLFATYLTMSKNDYVIAVVTPLLFIFLCWRIAGSRPIRTPYWRIWLAGFVLLGATYTFLHWAEFSVKLKLFTPEALNRNVQSRLILWRGAWDIFKAHPILGGGPGTYQLLFPQHRDVNYLLNEVGNITPDAHSLYLSTLSETGLLGFITFMGFIGWIVVLAWRRMRKAQDWRTRVLLAGLLCGIAGVMLASVTSPHLRRPVGQACMMVVLGATVSAATIGQTASMISLRQRQAFFTLSLVSLILFIAGLVYGLLDFSSAVNHTRGTTFLQVNGGRVERVKRAAAYLETAIRQNPAAINTYYKLASVYRTIGDAIDPKGPNAEQKQDYLRKSMRVYETLQRMCPDYADIHSQFGGLYVLLARNAKSPDERRQWLEKAAAEYDRAAAMSSRFGAQVNAADAHEQLASALVEIGRTRNEQEGAALARESLAQIGRAAAIYEHILTFDPNRPDIKAAPPEGDSGLLRTRRAYGFLLYHLNRDDEALEQLSRYLMAVPGDKEASDALARAMNRARDRKRMMEIIDELVRSNPLRIDYRIYRFTLLKADKRYEEAWLEVQRALRLVPGEQRSLLTAGELQIVFKNYPEARKYLQQAIEAKNPNPEYRKRAEDLLRKLDEAGV